MRDFVIALNRYYSKNKFIIWGFISIVAVFLIVVNAMERALQKNNNSSSVTNTTTIVAYNAVNNSTEIVNNVNTANKTYDEYISEISGPSTAIKTFVNFCNKGDTESAYNMLSDDCKQAVYPSVESFISNYYNVYFNGSKTVNISAYSSNNLSDVYKVNYMADALSTGNTSGQALNQDYIYVSSDYKLGISGFIKKQSINKTARNQYIVANVTYSYKYVNHEVYEVNFENLTNADMSIDDVYGAGHINLIDSDNNYYKINTQNYNEGDFSLSPNKSKTIKLQFENTGSKTKSYIALNNIQITNTQYTINNVDENTNIEGVYMFERKTTTYPNTISLDIAL